MNTARHASRLFLFAAATLLGFVHIAEACMGTPPPFCAQTLVLTTTGPDVVFAPGGGAINFNIDALGYFNVIEVPAGSCPGTLPSDMASLDVAVDAHCTGTADGGGTSTANALATGFNSLTLSIALDEGAPRICELSSTGTATLTDGSTLTATSSNTVCVGESLAGDPTKPRLDMMLVGGGSDIQKVHPGDQATVRYRITNNDPSETFTGLLSVSSTNSSRLPDQSPPGTVESGAYSVSAPQAGDNFPIGFNENLVNGCLYIPHDHGNPVPTKIEKFIDLAPGESTEVDIYARPFGGCSDGSCGNVVATLNGLFGDLSQGLACSGFVVAADTTVAPQYAWAQSGSAAVAMAPADFVVDLIASPQSGQTIPLSFVKSTPDISFNGVPTSLTPVPSSSVFDNSERGRIVVDVGNPGFPFLPGGATFSYSNEFQMSPGAPLAFNFTHILPNTPAGLESQAPSAGVTAALRPFAQTETEWFFDLFYQLSGFALFDNGERMPLVIDEFDVGPGLFPNAFLVTVSGAFPTIGSANVEVFSIVHDLRGFSYLNSDFDQDTLTDDVDNCILAANANQLDSNADGFGNLCDPDLNNDQLVNFMDLGLLKAAFSSSNPDADLNEDGTVNIGDLQIMRELFFGPPGPSAM